MQTRQLAVRADSMRREEVSCGWEYAYVSVPHDGGQLAYVAARHHGPYAPYMSAAVTPDDDGWSEETLPVADFISRIKAILTAAIDGAL